MIERPLTEFGEATIKDRYLLPGENYKDMFLRVAKHYSSNQEHCDRILSYMLRLWFMPATPILSNAGANKGLPISCFLNEVEDSLKSISDTWTENIWLARNGGGIGTYWGNLRSIGETLTNKGTTTGIIPFIKVMDSMTLAISQGSLRRGSAAVYLDVSHPEIEEFLDIRRPTGGDHNRKALNLNHAVCIDDKFMEAMINNQQWNLISPKTKEVIKTVSARELWIKILTTRMETGEPYMLFIDNINKATPEHHRKLGLSVKTSNLCSEITLPTGKDHLGNNRTAVCCLSSLNLEYFDEWKNDPEIIYDVMLFLDNVLTDFIEQAPDEMNKAKYSAMRERSVGLGVMGFHSYLQSKMVPFESATAKSFNLNIFKHIKKGADAASLKIATERGACPDALECGIQERFSHKLAIAPTASISIIAGESSPGIEPYNANAYVQKTLAGSFLVFNKHLKKLLQEKGILNDETISDIASHDGSVQHVSYLNDHEKMIFRTAHEIDQMWLIQHSADRTPFICQAQSLNIFLTGNVDKKKLHMIHYMAWKLGLKSLYYLRSTAINRAEKISHKHDILAPVEETYEECLACQ